VTWQRFVRMKAGTSRNAKLQSALSFVPQSARVLWEAMKSVVTTEALHYSSVSTYHLHFHLRLRNGKRPFICVEVQGQCNLICISLQTHKGTSRATRQCQNQTMIHYLNDAALLSFVFPCPSASSVRSLCNDMCQLGCEKQEHQRAIFSFDK
jgi:hypothetical protein